MTAAIGVLGWVLIVGALAIFAGVMVLLALSLRGQGKAIRPRAWIVGGGVLFPSAVLTALFIWTVADQPPWKAVPPAGSLIVNVTGHMWWWEVRYRDPASGAEVASANEVRIPAGRPVYFALASRDVIHSFWVPQLGGKMDMVPGRMQHLLVRADMPGTYRGQCAEFCGEQHARMALHVVVLEPREFDAWLRREAAPAVAADARHEAGRAAFLANRCDACHAVRGIASSMQLGPDLTHMASRGSIAAGTLPNTQAAREQWIANAQQVKPGVRMPSYERLDAATLAAMAGWLGSLQ